MSPSEGTTKCQGNVSALGNTAGDSVHRAEGRSTTRREEAGARRARRSVERRPRGVTRAAGARGGGRASRRRVGRAAPRGESSGFGSHEEASRARGRAGGRRARRATRGTCEREGGTRASANTSASALVRASASAFFRARSRTSSSPFAEKLRCDTVCSRITLTRNEERTRAVEQPRAQHYCTRYWYSYEREKRGVKISEGRAPRPRDRLMARCI